MQKLHNSNIKRAVAYARFSSDHQRNESIDAQMRAIRDYAQDNQILIVDEYIDRAKSATTDQRPEFQRMIEDSEKRSFDIIIVHKLDRFSRNRYDSAFYKRKLRQNGVVLHSVTEHLDDSPEGIFMESFFEGQAEYYSKNLAREVMKGLKENAYNCVHTGGKPPIGYDVDRDTKKLVINDYEAQSVKLIFQRFLEGRGYGEIIDELNVLGYKTKQGGYFTKNSLHSLLKNEKYTGNMVYNRSASKDVDGKRNGHKWKPESDWIRIEDAFPAIVSKDDFELVQQKMSTRYLTKKHSQ